MKPNTSISFVKSQENDSLLCTLAGDDQLETYLATQPHGVKVECNFLLLDHIYPVQEKRIHSLKEILNNHKAIYTVEEHLNRGCCVVYLT